MRNVVIALKALQEALDTPNADNKLIDIWQ